MSLSANANASARAGSNAIALYARATAGYDDRVAHAVALLRNAATAHAGAIVQATSLGAEDMVLTDLIARHRVPIAVGTLATGMLHPQTVALIGRIEARYAITVEVFEPVGETVVRFIDAHGRRAMYDGIELRKRCCVIRKLEPLARMQGRSAWVTGMRREQSANRGAVAFDAADEHGRIKFSPLADWSWADVWHYIERHGVPYNPMHDELYPSIGCAPCTRAIAVGEDFRAGRWWWEDEAAKECGLHSSARPDEAGALAPEASPSRNPSGNPPRNFDSHVLPIGTLA